MKNWWRRSLQWKLFIRSFLVKLTIWQIKRCYIYFSSSSHLKGYIRVLWNDSRQNRKSPWENHVSLLCLPNHLCKNVLFWFLLTFKATICLFVSTSYSGDPVSKSIGLLVHFLNVDFDADFWSQQISFLLAGGIIIATIRQFMNLVFQVLLEKTYPTSICRY